MLHLGGHDMPLPGVSCERGMDGGVAALGVATGENDFAQVSADQLRHLFPRRFNHGLQLGSEPGSARRIAPLLAETGPHGLEYRRQHGRGGVVVEVDHRRHQR